MRQIKEFPNYWVTHTGMVYSLHRNRYLKPDRNHKYERVALCKNSKAYHKYVHRLVLESFVGPCPKGMECRHLDGNSKNNYLWNLCWGTKKDNGADDRKYGVRQGIRNSQAKLTEQDVRQIYYICGTNLFTHRSVAEAFGVSKTTVNDIVNRKTWKHIWKKNAK